MGSVHLAYDTKLEREVAVKFMERAALGEPIAIKRFLREAKMLAQIEHPYVVKVTDYDQWDDGLPYIVMELVKGEPLSNKTRHGAIPESEAIDIALKLLNALAAVHELGIVHRDIKSSNIMLVKDGIKLIDFGIARSEHASMLTMKGKMIGTPAYMSPEQAMGEEIGPPSDLYSTGILLYEMLTGAVPFKTPIPEMTAMKHVHEPVPAIPDSVSKPIAKVITNALQKKPEKRFGSAKEMAAAVGLAFAQINSQEKKVDAPEKAPVGQGQGSNHGANEPIWKRHWRALILLGVLILVPVVLFGTGLRGWLFGSGAPAIPLPIQVTKNEARDNDPCWSPEGDRIVYASNPKEFARIFITDPNGAVHKCLTEGDSGGWDPSWGPNGQIAYCVAERNGRSVIYVMDEDGGNKRRLAPKLDLVLYYSQPTWGQDGRIYFVGTWGKDFNICVMDSDGNNVKILTTMGGKETAPSVGPTGRVAFQSDMQRESGKHHIYTMNLDGSDIQQVTHNSGSNEQPTWGSDGRIAFISDMDGSKRIYLMKSDGTEMKKVIGTTMGDLSVPNWAPGPDGRIAYVFAEHDNTNVYTVAPETDVTKFAR